MNGLNAMFVDIQSKIQVALKSKSPTEILAFQVAKGMWPDTLILQIDTPKAVLSGLLKKEDNNPNRWEFVAPLSVQDKEVKK